MNQSMLKIKISSTEGIGNMRIGVEREIKNPAASYFPMTLQS